MNRDIQEIISEIDFNYDKDKDEFGGGTRNVTMLSSISEEGKITTLMTFTLGKKKDDDINLTFDTKELIAKLIETVAFGENFIK